MFFADSLLFLGEYENKSGIWDYAQVKIPIRKQYYFRKDFRFAFTVLYFFK